MAATYISLDSEQSQVTARYARDLRNRMEETRTNLRIYQQQLDIYVKSMEKRFKFSFNDTVPLGGLALQEKRMREIADLFDRAAALAREYDGDMASQTDMLDLAVASMDNIGSYAGTIGVITGVLTGENSVGDGWVDVYTGPTREEIIADMQQRYDELRREHNGSFAEACSRFVYRQLGSLGVITRGKDASAPAGKDWYKIWSTKSTTTTGYQVNPYSRLSDLLNAHPDELLTNIVLSFDYDGKKFTDAVNGHIVLITAIKDGMVYFMDNGSTDTELYQAETPTVLTIEQFLACYPAESTNGVIHYTK